MMYRAGWGEKENQEHILAIRITRSGFDWALDNCSLSHYDSKLHSSYDEWQSNLKESPVRLQWDPEKDLFLQPLPYRSIQIGLSGKAVNKYINEWIVGIDEITADCKAIKRLIDNGNI